MRLHNRQVKAAFWDDPKLLRLHRDARTLFHGLWHLADDSGCLEYDTFAFKTFLFRSPLDDDMSLQRLEELTTQLIDVDLLVVYEANRRRCLFIRNFHKHQSLRSPAPPEVPLPPWVQWVAADAKQRSGTYAVESPDGHLSESVEQPNGDRKETVRTPNGDRSEPKGNQARARNEPEPEPEPEREEEPLVSPPAGAGGRQTKGRSAAQSKDTFGDYPMDFDLFWQAYPRKTEKKAAFKQWKAQNRKGATAAQLLQAARNYAEECQQDGREEKFIKHGATFLGPNDPWREYLEPKPPPSERRPPARRSGYQDPAANGPVFDPNGPWGRK